QVRNNAVLAMGQNRYRGTREALEQVLLDEDEDPTVRSNAAWALGEKHARRSVDALLQVLSEDEAKIRNSAIIALAKIGDIRAAPFIAEVLDAPDPDSDVRSNAAWALGILKDPSAFDVLVRALDDGIPTVRAAAVWALGELADARALLILKERLDN